MAAETLAEEAATKFASKALGKACKIAQGAAGPLVSIGVGLFADAFLPDPYQDQIDQNKKLAECTRRELVKVKADVENIKKDIKKMQDDIKTMKGDIEVKYV